MQLTQELPDHAYVLRAADGASARVNDRVLHDSFILAPDQLIEGWPARDPRALQPADLHPVLDLQPELILLGTGATQVFPAPAVLAACMTRGIGIEVMNNAAAARTFHVLASEGRRVVAAFLLSGA